MQHFPNKPLRIVTVTRGGGVDLVARIIAQGISGPLGQPVTVDNRVGISGIESVAQALPDGHTLLYFGPSFWTAPLLQKVNYDPVKDFAPITLAISQPNILVVHPSVKAVSVRELIELAHAHPGELKYASGVIGSSSQLAAALFAYMADIDIVGIPYKESVLPGVCDLIAGKIQLMIFSAGSGMEHIRAGKLRALAVTSAEPTALAPGLPTVAATLPGYESVHVQGVYAPAYTPAPIIDRLNREIVQILNTAEVKKQLLSAGIEAIGTTPEVLAVTVKTEIARVATLIKSLEIKAG